MTRYGITTPGYPDCAPDSRTILRTYNTGQRNSVPAGWAQALSYTPTQSFRDDLRGATTPAAQTAAINTLISYWQGVADVPQCGAMYDQEKDNNSGNPSGPQFAAEHNIINAQVRPVVNAGRTNPVLFGPAMSVAFFNRTAADQATWLASGWDFFGFQPYANLNNVTAGNNVATSLGIPFWLTEFGTSVAVNPPDTGSGSHVEHINAAIALYSNFAVPPPVVLWFDQNHNLLNTTFRSAAAVGATSISVDAIPGKPDVSTWQIVSGSPILLDPNGLHPETVTLTATTTSSSSSGPYTLAVTPLAFAHANTAPIWLMPQTVAKLISLNTPTGPIVGTFGNNSGAATTDVTFVIPTQAVPGTFAYFLVTWGGTSTVTLTPPAGSTIPGAFLDVNNVLNGTVYTFTIGASGTGRGPGDTVHCTLSSAQRWAVAGFTSAYKFLAGNVTTTFNSTATTTPAVAALTPTNTGDQVVAFVATRDATAGNSPTFAPPSGWTEDTDRYSNSTSSNVGAYLMHKAGTAGVQSPATTITSGTDAVQSISWTLDLTGVGGGTFNGNDSFPISDVVTRGPRTSSTRALGDVVPLADIVSRSQTAAGSQLADSVPLADVITRSAVTRNSTGTDSIPVAEVLTRVQADSRPTSDSVPVAEALARSQAQTRGLADSVPLADAAVGSAATGGFIGAPVSSGGGQAADAAPTCTLPALVGGEVIFCELSFNLATGATLSTPPTVNGVAMTLLGSGTKAGQLIEATYVKVATAADSHAVITAALSSGTAWEMLADCYQGASHVFADHVYNVAVETNSVTAHTTPTVSVVKSNSWLREVSVDKFSPASTSMTPTAPIIQRSQVQNTNPAGAGCMGTGDSNGIVATGTRGGDVWNGTVNSSRAVMSTVGIAPAANVGGATVFLADSVPLADAVTRTQGTQARATADQPLSGEAVTRAAVFSRALSDSVPVADVVTRVQAASRPTVDAIPVVEALTRGVQAQPRGLADQPLFGEAVTRAQALVSRATADSVPLADVVTRGTAKAANLFDAIPITEHLVSAKGTVLRTFAEAIPVFEVITRSQVQVRHLTDDMTITESLTRATFDLPYTIGRISGGTQSVKVPPMTSKVR